MTNDTDAEAYLTWEEEPTAFDDSGVSSRTKGRLESLNIRTLQELADCTDEQKARLFSAVDREEIDRLNGQLRENQYAPLDYDDIKQKYEQWEIPPDTPLDELVWSVRAFNCLMRAGYCNVRNLLDSDGTKVVTVRNLGKKCYKEEVEDLMIRGMKQPAELWDYNIVKPKKFLNDTVPKRFFNDS